MSEKKTQTAVEKIKAFDPLDHVVVDSIENGFFGSGKLDMQKLIDNCRKRGLVGIWTQQSLSKPLTLFVQASERMTSDDVDALLSSFAKIINFDINLVKQHFYAIYQGWEKEFLQAQQDAEIAFDETPAEQDEETETAYTPVFKQANKETQKANIKGR